MSAQIHSRLKKASDLCFRNEVMPAPARPTDGRSGAAGPVYAGLDLGTADIVLLLIDESGEPVGGKLQWAEVVRDGVVTDYVGARDIVRRMVDEASRELGRPLESCATSFPPGTDPDLSSNVVRDCGLRVPDPLDEPTVAALALGIADGVVVDIGGGTTGISVLRGGRVVRSVDEATGGRHLSLVIAGSHKIKYEEAELRKRGATGTEYLNVVRPVIEKMASIVERAIRDYPGLPVVLVGGTPSMKGFDEVFAESLGRPVTVPPDPMFVTPLGIALSGLPARVAAVR